MNPTVEGREGERQGKKRKEMLHVNPNLLSAEGKEREGKEAERETRKERKGNVAIEPQTTFSGRREREGKDTK